MARTRVVKSKSMLTEECGLNPHLEKLGIEVTDTDLGEWIVQLRARASQPHRHARDSRDEGGGQPTVPRTARHGGRRDRSSVSGRGSPPTFARKVSRRRGRHHRRQLCHCRNGRLCRLHKRRQCRSRRFAAEATHRLHGHRKADSASWPISACSCGYWPAPRPANRSPPTRRTFTGRFPAASCISYWSIINGRSCSEAPISAAR